MSPLVSCLMPTFNRRPFIARAIAYFQRQTYENRELVILDDGDDPIADLVPDNPAIRYIRARNFANLGAKRNAACEAAKGDILLHWDDDDWYAPHRVKIQVEALRESGADLCGIDRAYFLNPAAPEGWEYVYPSSGPPWVCGATLCFRREFWRANPFTPLNIGEDTIFAAAANRARMHVLPDKDIFVGLIHAANSCPRRTQDAYWRRAPLEEIRSAMGVDWRNYVADETSPSIAPLAVEKVSVVIPHGGEQRLPHLAACLAHLAQARGVGEIILVEQGEKPVAREVAERWGAKHVFARNNGPFSRARGLNIGTALATCDHVLWLDNDLLVAPDFIVAAAKEMQRGDLDFLIPYSIIHYLSESDSEKVREGAIDPNSCRPVLSLAPGLMVSGGAGLLRKDFFRRHGGIPEGFRGWGGEDNAWAHKANLLGRSGVGADSAQKLWHMYHPTSGAHDARVHHKNPHYAENLRLLEKITAIHDKRLFVEKFPPQSPSCPWERDKTIVFVAGAARAAANRAAEGMKQLLGLDIGVMPADSCLAVRLQNLAPAPDAIVLFGADESVLAPGNENFTGRTVVLSEDELEADSLALASALAPPLSHLLNGVSDPMQIPTSENAEDLAVWTYWEGECPEWIVACRASIAAHAPRVRFLDRKAFESLREHDRDIDIDRLEIAHRADFIRAYLLAHYGGLWIDCDCIAMKSLAPLLDFVRDDDFLAHRDRQNFYPNGFIGARRGSVIAREFYRRLCAILRSGATLGWISLGGQPLTQLLTSAKTPFREIPCEWIQPVCWSLPETFFVVADAATHEGAINPDAYCYMLSNTEIRKYQAAHPERELTRAGSFFRFLIDRSAQNALSPHAQEDCGSNRAMATLFAEAMSFFLSCYADGAPRRVVEVAHRLGLWGAMIGNLAGVELHGVACAPADEGEKGFHALYAGVTEAEASAPLDQLSGQWELLVLSDPLRDWPDALRASLVGRALELSKNVMVWNCRPSNAGMDKYFSSDTTMKVDKRRVARAENLVMEALLLRRESRAAKTIDPATRDIFERLYRSNVAAAGESVSGPGSSLGQTAFLRRSLPLLLQNFGVRSLIDAPCGDFNWMRHVELGIDSYLGVDIVEAVVERNQNAFANARRQFRRADITRQILPCADLILCRDCLVHLCFEDIRLALRNFWRSGATYLLITNFAPHRANEEIATGDWRPLNFQADPFNFPPPLRRLVEGCTEMSSIYADKSLSLWRLRDIEQLIG